MDASRWSYNLTVEILKSGIPAVWQRIAAMVMSELKRGPYQRGPVGPFKRSTAVGR